MGRQQAGQMFDRQRRQIRVIGATGLGLQVLSQGIGIVGGTALGRDEPHIDGIGDRQEATLDGDGGTGQALRVTTAVPAFVMFTGQSRCQAAFGGAEQGQPLPPLEGMLANTLAACRVARWWRSTMAACSQMLTCFTDRVLPSPYANGNSKTSVPLE